MQGDPRVIGVPQATSGTGIAMGQPPMHPRANLVFGLGLGSISICCGLVGIPAIVLGALALEEMKKAPGVYGGRDRILTGMATGAAATLFMVVWFAASVVMSVSDASVGAQSATASSSASASVGFPPPSASASAVGSSHPDVGPELGCKYSDAKSTRCYEPKSEACVEPGTTVRCRDTYWPLGPTVNNWVRDGKWAGRRGEILFLDVDVQKNSKEPCYSASLHANIYVCPSEQSTAEFKSGKLTHYVGFARMTKYEEGLVFDDLYVDDLDALSAEAEIAMERSAMAVELALRRFGDSTDEFGTGSGKAQLAKVGDAYVVTAGKTSPIDLLAMALVQQEEVVGQHYVLQQVKLHGVPVADYDAAHASVKEGIQTLSPFQRAAFEAIGTAVEEIVKGKEWTLYPPGTRDCGAETSMSEPAVEDEFELRTLKSQRARIRNSIVGTRVAFAGHGDLAKGSVEVGPYALIRGKYDFRRGTYSIVLTAGSSDWPLERETPRFTTQTFQWESDVKIGSIGGRDVKVRSTQSDTMYSNGSQLRLDVKMPEDRARAFKDEMPVHLVIIQEFRGLGFHKVCKMECIDIPIFGRDCGSTNTGFGTHYLARLVGYELYVGDELVVQDHRGMR